tara:strand:- start:84 stop:710 length:627 start_codon:yes stop_codon:yes gene_type:complete
MKTKIEIFSTEELKIFFTNIHEFFDLSIKSLVELETSHDKKNLSIVFLEKHNTVFEKTIKKIYENENFIFVCKDFSIFQKFSLKQKNTFISPITINKLIDIINNFINTRKHTFTNIELNNNLVTNIKTNQKIDLTQAESHILLKLFKEKSVKKRILERDALQIKQKLNTSSMESHLNRIRKKLKKISSHFTISSKEQCVYLEIINQDT